MAFLASWWRLKGRPTYCILIREDLLKSPNVKEFINFLAELRSGTLLMGSQTVNVQLGRAQNFVQSSCLEHLDFLNGCDDESPNTLEDSEESHCFRFRHFNGRDETVRVKSLQDLVVNTNADSAESAAAEKDVCIADIEKTSSSDLVARFPSLTSLSAQADVLCILAQRHSLAYTIDGRPLDELVATVCRRGMFLLW